MTKSAKLGLVIGGAMILAPFLSFAQTPDIQDDRQGLRQNATERVRALNQEIKAKRAALHDEIVKKRETFREEAQKRKDALKKKLGEARAKRIEQFFGNMMEKFEKAIDRLEKFADRIDERLNKAAERGKDVVTLKDMLTKAREKITATETTLADAKVKYSEATASNQDFKIAFKRVHELVKGVAVKVKEAHRALVDIIKSTKGLGVERAATTTPSN